MSYRTLTATTLLLFLACKGDPGEDGEGPAISTQAAKASTAAPQPADSPKKATPALPTTTERVVLNTDGHEIPASIEMPTGSTIFADTPTTLRVGFDGKDEFGRRKSLFAVQLAKGNEFNLDLKQLAKDLGENKYGSTNEILEQSENLLLYKSTAEGGFVGHQFRAIVELAGAKWLCKQGNDGGWTEEQARAQLAACKTLESL